MGNAFRTLAASELRAFFDYKGVRHTGPHEMKGKILHWLYCSNCGLLNLKNEVTRKALKAPCVWFE